MIIYRLQYFKIIFLIVFISGLLFSCTSTKKMIYLRKESKNITSSDTLQTIQEIQYKIRPKDNLYIRFVSLDEKAMEYSQGSQNYATTSTESSVFLTGFDVNDSGYVQIPLIGDIKVAGLTMRQAKDTLQKAIGEYILNASVVVKLTNFRITLLGEVASPGSYYVYANNINIFQALSLAGDMASYGNSRKVKLIRVIDNKPTMFNLNLTDKNILFSDKYFLQPDDIIYVEPNATAKTMGFVKVPWEILFSGISTTILIISFLTK